MGPPHESESGHGRRRHGRRPAAERESSSSCCRYCYGPVRARRSGSCVAASTATRSWSAAVPSQRHPADRCTFEQRVVNVRRGFQETVYCTVQRGHRNRQRVGLVGLTTMPRWHQPILAAAHTPGPTPAPMFARQGIESTPAAATGLGRYLPG